MHNRDLDKSSMMDDRMRNREDIDRDMFEESKEDLQRKQSEGNLGNERVRDRSRSSGDDMRGTGDE
jgi:hypothetical protein